VNDDAVGPQGFPQTGDVGINGADVFRLICFNPITIQRPKCHLATDDRIPYQQPQQRRTNLSHPAHPTPANLKPQTEQLFELLDPVAQSLELVAHPRTNHQSRMNNPPKAKAMPRRTSRSLIE